jgi:membrane-bound serine protease (ClpP class)
MTSLLFFTIFSLVSRPQEPSIPPKANPSCTIEVSITGPIGLASLDMLNKGLSRAKADNCSSVLLSINTPGGSLQTTRMMVESILNSSVPVLCLVYPSGAHAGSAGAIILQACHVNGAMRATNLGAATPVTGDGQTIPEDMRKKMLNDTTSWVDSMTELRGRNKQFGREIITEAKAVSATEAQKIGAIDFVADKKMDFLNYAQGRTVKMSEDKEQIVQVGDLVTLEATVRDQVLALVTDPQTAYLLFMGSLALIYFEITHPGTIVAGVTGGIGLVVSLVALHKLDAQWGGLMLLLIGVALLIAESFVASFGVLGAGGIVAFIAGSLFLFDPQTSGGYRLPLDLIVTTSLILGLSMFGLAYMAFKTRDVRRKGSYDDLLGETGVVVVVDENQQSGQLEVNGETWRFESKEKISVDQKVVINQYKGLTLTVSSKKEA